MLHSEIVASKYDRYVRKWPCGLQRKGTTIDSALKEALTWKKKNGQKNLKLLIIELKNDNTHVFVKALELYMDFFLSVEFC